MSSFARSRTIQTFSLHLDLPASAASAPPAAASAPAGGADTVVGYDGANANSAPISGGGKKRGGKSKKQKGGCGTCTL